MSTRYIENTDKALVGIDRFHYAPLIEDTETKLEYGDMAHLPNTVNISVAMNASTETLYADNKAAIIYSSIGNVELTAERTTIPEDVLAEWLGSTMEGGVRYVSQEQNSPYMGVAWRQVYSDGSYSYVKLYKGKFTEPDKSAVTKGETVEFQTASIVANFASTNYVKEVEDGGVTKEFPLLMSVASEDAEGYTNEGDTWFNAMYPAPVGG